VISKMITALSAQQGDRGYLTVLVHLANMRILTQKNAILAAPIASSANSLVITVLSA
jgi:hypothetical protein